MPQTVPASGPSPARSTLTHRLRLVASWLAAAAIAIGTAAIMGWLTRLEILRVGPTLNTGVLQVLAGVALALLARRVARPNWLAASLSGVIVVVSGSTLIEYLTGIDLRIDNLLFQHPADGSKYIGRMSVVSGSGLLLCGCSLVLLSLRRNRRRLAQLQRLALGSFAIGLLALLGHIYQAHFFTQIDPLYQSIAPATTLGLISVSLAILMVSPAGPVSSPFTSPTSAGAAARRMVFLHLPWLLVAVLLLTRIERFSLLGAGEAAALRNLVLLGALLVFGWRAFRQLDRAERRSARALAAAEQAEEEANAEVARRTTALTATTVKAEAARARLHAVMESAPDLIVAIDHSYRFVVANQAYVESVRANQGVTVVPGMHYDQAYRHSSEYLARGRESWRRALAGERHTTIDETRQANGDVRIHERLYGPVIDSDGRVIGAVGVKRDITARRRLELEAARNRTIVEQRNRDLETLLHVISHDLKEPLRSIESFSRLLAKRLGRQLDEKSHDFLERVVRATGRMGQLLEEIQLLARARQAEPAVTRVDGDEVVREVLARLEGTIRESHAVVTVQPTMPSIKVQRVWATEALYNLVANALKFPAAGRPAEVLVAPWRQDGLIGFQVLDRGPGVPVEQSDRIFELFQRGVGREVPGTGAGLAIVRQIAERHGGRAWVEPRGGGGSVFTVAFAADHEWAA